jgi:hypothetical protein
MITLQIEHPITDYATWRRAFDGFAGARRTAEVRGARVFRPVDDAHEIVVTLDFDTRARAEAFVQFLREQVWSTPARSPGLAGAPRTRLLESADAVPAT